MGRIQKIIIVFAAAALALQAVPAVAATNGALGVSSTATANVSLVIPEQVRVSNVRDINFGAYNGSGNVSGSTGLCIYSNGSGNYQVRVTGASSGSFQLETAEHAAIPMNVSWNGSAALAHGAALTVSESNTQDPGCAGGSNASLDVAVSEASLKQATPGAYAGTLTITVEPN